MRVAAGRNVTSGGIDWHQPLPQFKTGQNFQREIMNRGALRVGESPHLARRKDDVVLYALRNIARLPLDRGSIQHNIARPIVKLESIVAYRLFAAGLAPAKGTIANQHVRFTLPVASDRIKQDRDRKTNRRLGASGNTPSLPLSAEPRRFPARG